MPNDTVTDDKLDEFRAAVATLKLRTGRQRADLVRQVIGGILMLGGFIAGLIIYEQSLSQSSALNIGSEQILALSMIGVVVIGAALFVSASLARFLRFWMLRQLYEGQAHIDRLVGGISSSERL
jgi:formate hydrogenlyase subunit 3/multisubunit Na+/H+ antiporter MnhD subunit